MINRFKFHHEDEGRDIHCLILEIPRKGARVPCISLGGKFYRVPAGMLTNVPEGSPITAEKATELGEKGQKHIAVTRNQREAAKARREMIDRQLAELLGFSF